MKPLKPSHREKKRYLLIKGKDAGGKDIEKAILDFIGILGYAEANPIFIKTLKDEGKDKIILSINRKMVDKVRTCFLLSGKDIKITKVSGSLGKVK